MTVERSAVATAGPDERLLDTALSRARNRLLLRAALRGATAGLVAGCAASLVIGLVAEGGLAATLGVTLASAVAGALAAVVIRSGKETVAMQVERLIPASTNVIVTADELRRGAVSAPGWIRDDVIRSAAAAASRLDLPRLIPVRREAVWVTAAAAAAVIIALLIPRDDGQALPRTLGRALGLGDAPAIDVIVRPPAYSRRPVATLRNPARVEALAGSTISVMIRGETGLGVLETLAGRRALQKTDAGLAASFVADGDGFIALLPADSTQGGSRRLIGLTVIPDAAPRVRITTPGRDLFLGDSRRALDVTVEADDDLALASLRLRYTKVSGSGERFTFVEGTVPVAVSRASGRAWKASGRLDLSSLGLEPGDMVVYRGVATDERPGAPPAESDAFLVEITAPGMLAAEGFSLDDEQDKYALSQQMIILKTERLLARAPSLPKDSLAYYAQSIAAEQRSVRAEFVFMMGGEIAEEIVGGADIDEEHEAAAEADLGAGRMVNRGRAALLQAIRAMSRASTLLNDTNLVAALPQEKVALASLQQAFSRTRYLLRALTLRERLDLSRRLTGTLTTAGRDAHPLEIPSPDERVVALRRALSGMAAVAALDDPQAGAAESSAIGRQVLRIDPSADQLQAIAGLLDRASTAFGGGNMAAGQSRLDSAAVSLTALLRGELPAAPRSGASDLRARQLEGALRDARRGGAR